MQPFYTITMGVCITMIVTTVFSLLISDYKLERVMRFALSLFFLTVFFYPLSQSFPSLWMDFSADQAPVFRIEQQLEDSMQTVMIAQLQIQAEALLQQSQIPYQKVEVTTHNSEETGIMISKVTVWLDDKNLTAPATYCLESYFGIKPEIKVGEENE